MEQEFVVLQGKAFTVALQSMLGSTNYGWCVSSMPEGIVLLGTENESSLRMGPVIQKFYFQATSGEQPNVEIKFILACLSDLTKVENEYTLKVRIVQSDSEEFVTFSENAANAAMPYGFVYGGEAVMKYGYPCEAQAVNAKYGYPADELETTVKYGYPCGVQEANLMYGYSCGVKEANLKYGYPCGVQETNLKYGYPCGVQEANLKYGYPCGVQDANLKYGYPCGVQEMTNLKYGYPCGTQDASLKYGYPCGVQDANLKYGYPCMEWTKDARPYGFPNC